MQDNKLKFECGWPVVIKLVEATAPSFCRLGYKVGDSWVVNIWENSGLCGLAYNAFFSEITMFQTGGEAVWKRIDTNKDSVTRSCPDLRPGFRFLITRGNK